MKSPPKPNKAPPPAAKPNSKAPVPAAKSGKAPPAAKPGKAREPMAADKQPKVQPPHPMRPDTGEVQPHRIPIYDHKGNMRGHVGHRATGATVARFLGRHGADLTDKDGRPAWVGHRPPPPPPPPPTILPDGTVIPGHPGGPPNIVKGDPMGGAPGGPPGAKGGSPVGKPTGGREKSPDPAAARGSAKPKGR